MFVKASFFIAHPNNLIISQKGFQGLGICFLVSPQIHHRAFVHMSKDTKEKRNNPNVLCVLYCYSTAW